MSCCLEKKLKPGLSCVGPWASADRANKTGTMEASLVIRFIHMASSYDAVLAHVRYGANILTTFYRDTRVDSRPHDPFAIRKVRCKRTKVGSFPDEGEWLSRGGG